MKRIENKDENDEKVPSFNAIHLLLLQSSCFRHLGGTKGQCFAITQAAIDPTLKTNPISEYVVILDKITTRVTAQSIIFLRKIDLVMLFISHFPLNFE